MNKLTWIAVLIGTLVITACSDTGGPGITTGPANLAGMTLIQGDPIKGETLTADTSFLDGAGTFSYQWLRDGEPITDETAATYVIANDDIGCKLALQITLAGFGGFVQSASVGPVIDPEEPPELPAGLYFTALLDEEEPPEETGILAGLFTWLEDDNELLPGFSYTLVLGTEPETITRKNLNSETLASNLRLTLLGPDAGAEIALNGNGPLFAVGETITLKLENTTLKGHDNNTAALVWVQGRSAVLEMENSAIKDNTNTSEPVDNKADGHGGGVFVWKGRLTMSGASEISGNKTKGEGGGITLPQGGILTISDTSVISGNTADGSGGGIFVSNGAKVTISDNSVVSGNKAGENGGGWGGGIHVGNSSTLTISDTSVISNNETGEGGGGIWAGSGATITMSASSKITNNTAKKSGGGIGLWNSVTLIMSNTSEISENTAKESAGGIWAGTGSTIAMSGSSTINKNKADKVGGGIGLWESSTITMSANSVISNNETEEGGGGIHAGNGSTITMSSSSKINGNTAAERGGGIRLSQSTLTMSGGEISGNTAAERGGGVFITWSSTFKKTGGVIYGYNDEGNESKHNKVEADGNVKSDTGHAIYVNNNPKGRPRRNNTVSDSLSYTGVEDIEGREDENLAAARITGNWTTTP